MPTLKLVWDWAAQPAGFLIICTMLWKLMDRVSNVKIEMMQDVNKLRKEVMDLSNKIAAIAKDNQYLDGELKKLKQANLRRDTPRNGFPVQE